MPRFDERRGIGPQTTGVGRQSGSRNAGTMVVPGVGEVTTPPGDLENRSAQRFADVIPGVTADRGGTQQNSGKISGDQGGNES